MGTGQSHCVEEEFVTINFNVIDDYSDFFETDALGNITEIKIDMFKHYRLENTIDFSGKDFISIGTKAPFQGHFWGSYEVIENITLVSGSFEKLGVFGVLGDTRLYMK